MDSNRFKLLLVAAASALACAGAFAQQAVYPAKGQPPDQQKSDEVEATYTEALALSVEVAPKPAAKAK